MTQTPDMNRDEHLARTQQEPSGWDVIIIGGGATGLGSAVDSAARGYRTLLLEQSDFGKGTSSRSTKLVHGGVRYLQQGNLSLVYEALRERGLLLQNAPHLAGDLTFVVPCYKWWERTFYGVGLKTYDLMSRDLSLGDSHMLSRRETLGRLPTISGGGLRGGVLYHDGQFDDSRLAVNLAQTAVELGATVLNYAPVHGLLRENGRVAGVVAADGERGEEFTLRGKTVINATGVFADSIRRMDHADATDIIQPSQGVHIVVDRSFMPGDSALMVPRTDDGRVLFAVPWHDRLLIGTTDTPLDVISLEPTPLENEVEFLLRHANRYLDAAIGRSDVLSVFAGLRPLFSAGTDEDTASISRDHVLRISKSGLITITGGKWTTYRKMAEDTIDKAAQIGGLGDRPCETDRLPIHGWTDEPDTGDEMGTYGADAAKVTAVSRTIDHGDEPIHERLPYRRGDVHWAARFEMARTVDDVLSRRTRALLLDARASVEAAPAVASILARELGRDEAWARRQVADFEKLAKGYVLTELPGTRTRDRTPVRATRE